MPSVTSPYRRKCVIIWLNTPSSICLIVVLQDFVQMYFLSPSPFDSCQSDFNLFCFLAQSPVLKHQTLENSPISSCDTSDTECSVPVNSAVVLKRHSSSSTSPCRGHVLQKAKVRSPSVSVIITWLVLVAFCPFMGSRGV